MVFNIMDANKTCRTCLKSDTLLVHLYDTFPIENNEVNFAEALMKCISTTVQQLDGSPQHLCIACKDTLVVSYTFRLQALQADTHIKNALLETIKHEDTNEDMLFDDSMDFKCEDSSTSFEIKTEKIEDPVLRCLLCPKKFTSQKKLDKHLLSHEDNALKCRECDKTYQKQSSLDRHITKHHLGPVGHLCTLCGEVLQDNRLLVEHMLAHSEGIQVKTEVDVQSSSLVNYKCPLCDLEFSKQRSLSSHMKKHKNYENGYQCDICQMIMSRKNLLRRHMRLHNSDKPFKCDICDKSYPRSDQYKDHMRRHQGIKPNVCPYCNKAFTQRCSLKDHIRTHTGETPFLCSECGKGFNNSSNLRQHLMRHSGLKPFTCSLCPKSFTTKGQLTCHIVTHTGAHPFKCEQCDASFTKSQSLKKHSLIHLGLKPFLCDVCPMRFTDRNHLKRHQRIHTGEKPYICNYCSRAFTQSNDLVKHMRSHIGKNIYKCSVCNLGFRLQSELKNHYPTHYMGEDVQTIATAVMVNPEQATLKIESTSDSNKENSTERTITLTFNHDGNKVPEDITASFSIS